MTARELLEDAGHKAGNTAVKQRISEAISMLWPTSAVIVGLNDLTGWGTVQTAGLQGLGFRAERVELGGPYTKVSQSVASGCSGLAVIVGNTPDEAPLSAVNIPAWVTATMEQIHQEVVPYAEHVAVLECGNEMYLKGSKTVDGKYVSNIEEPAVYAEMYVALKQALIAAGISLPLGWDTNGDYQRADGSWSQIATGGGWNGDAVKAFPQLKTMIDCVIAHPYGKPHSANAEHSGPKGMEEQHAQLVSLGVAHTDVYITEYGVGMTEAGGEAQQAQQIKEACEEFLGLSYVKGLWYFQTRDQGSYDCGLFAGSSMTVRPSLDVLASFLVS